MTIPPPESQACDVELQEEEGGQGQDGHRAVSAHSLMQEGGWGVRGNVDKGSCELARTNATGSHG